MKTLTLGNLTRTFSLISAGALLGIFLLAPLGVGASHNGDDGRPANVRGEEPPAVFVLRSTTGQNFRFTLVENGGGEMEFTLVPPAAPRFIDDDD